MSQLRERVDRAKRRTTGDSWLEQHYLQHTWCNNCEEADIGMRKAVETEEDGRRYMEGACVRCGEPVKSEIVEEDATMDDHRT